MGRDRLQTSFDSRVIGDHDYLELPDKSRDYGNRVIGASPADIEWANSFSELPIEREIETPKSTNRFADAFSAFFNRLSLPVQVDLRLGAPALTLAILGAFVASASSGESSVDASNESFTPVERDLLSNERVINNETVDKPSVRAVYMVPADKEVNADYAEGIENAMKDIQRWFHNNLDSQNTFRLHSPNVITISSSRNSEWFRTNIGGPLEFNRLYDNVRSEASSLIPEFDNGDKWVVIVDADSTPDQGGALGGGTLAVLDGDFLRGLSGEFTPTEGQAPSTVFATVGYIAHELAHTLKLGHSEESCTEDPCPLMAEPWKYPMVELDQNEEDLLEASSFFDLQFIKSDPEFQVEVRMFNLADTADEWFALNGVEFMQLYYPLDTGRMEISDWVEPGSNIIDFQGRGSTVSTHGFQIFIDNILVYEDICGEPDVFNCKNWDFSDSFIFDAPIITETPTQAASFTPTDTLMPVNTPTPTPERTATPTEQPVQSSGDVNCDSSVNAIDSALILQMTAGLIGTLRCEFNGDVSEDGTISSIDAALILQLTAGLIDDF